MTMKRMIKKFSSVFLAIIICFVSIPVHTYKAQAYSEMAQKILNDTTLELTAEKKQTMATIADELLKSGYEPAFICGVLGNIALEGSFGLFEGTTPAGHTNYMVYMNTHYQYYQKFSYKYIYNCNLTEVCNIDNELYNLGYPGKFGLGCCQWTAGRTHGLLQKYIEIAGSGNTITREQVTLAESLYMVQELNGGYHSVYTNWSNANSGNLSSPAAANSAGKIFCTQYEKPSKYEEKQYERGNMAERIYNVCVGGTPLPCDIRLSGFQNPTEGYVHPPGANCGLYGTITSNHTLKHVWGGVYKTDGTPASGSSTTCDDYPSSTSYSLRGKFNNSIIFDDIPEGSYYFSISAEDNDGFKKELIHNNFTVGNPLPSTYSVSLNANGGSVSPTSITVLANGTYSGLPTPDRYGYDFAGWFDDSGRQVWDGVGIYTNSDHTLYARWNPKSITVNLNATGGSVSSSSIQVNFDNKYSNLPSAEKPGYNFNGWFTVSDGGTQVDSNSVCNTVDEHTLFAHWDKNKIMITFNAIGGTVETANKLVVYDNKYGILPTPEKKGYEFKGWYLDESYTKPITKDTIVDVTENKTVYAKWNIRQFVITFDAREGTPDVETKRVVFGKAYGVLPEATLGEEVFLGWFTADGTEITSESIVELEEDTVLYAQWRIQGDVNADGLFDKDDIIMVQDWLLAKPDATLNDWHAADVCKDERIDVFDLCILKRMLLERNGEKL